MKAWLVAALLLSGCAGAPPRVSLAEPSPAPTAGDYVDQLKRWTRHAQIRSDFDEALDVDATLRSPEFRQAYAAKYLEVYRIPPDTEARVRGEILADGADTYEFHVETATHNYDLNDLTSAKSVWRVSLLDDQQHEVTPTTVAIVELTKTTPKPMMIDVRAP